MSSQLVKGFNEFTGPEAAKRAKIRKVIENEFLAYGFEPAETPIIERVDFAAGDNVADDSVRDMFRLEDRGKRKLALRYEFTFQLKRLARNQKLPFKRFQIGSCFRDEPIRQGRVREFIQCDADIIGSSLKDEAECLRLGKNVFEKLGMPVTVYVNNRKLVNEILVSENIEEKKRRQIIREIDKLDKLSKKEVADNLKKLGAERVLDIFTGEEKSFEKYNFYKEIKDLRKICKLYGVEFEFRPFLARGQSYYNGTVFEIWSDKLSVSLCGGGAYLVGDTQACGISFGFEPIFLLSDIEGEVVDILVLSLGQDKAAVDLAERLREEGVNVNLLMDKAIGKGLDYANSKGIDKVIFVGEDEVKVKKFRVKDMKSGTEEMLGMEEVLGKVN